MSSLRAVRTHLLFAALNHTSPIGQDQMARRQASSNRHTPSNSPYTEGVARLRQVALFIVGAILFVHAVAVCAALEIVDWGLVEHKLLVVGAAVELVTGIVLA